MQKILPPNAILIPDTASRVFAGDIFDVYQWPQELFDGRTKSFEMLKRPDTVAILVIRNHELLFIHDEQPGRPPRLTIPMGRVDAGDGSWLMAAQRELREEAGLVCTTWRLLQVAQPVAKIEWFASLFLAQDITDEQTQQLDPGGEKISMEWKQFEDIRALVLSGVEPTLHYMIPLFSKVQTMDELIALPAYVGVHVDR
jgi:8-oxo-dGTP pyrophosphatase MutT (NUDIX family)